MMQDPKTAACRRTATFRQYLTAFVVNLSAFNIGTVMGWTSPMLPLLTSNNPPVGSEPMSTELISWLGSVNFIGGLCGSCFWGIFSDRFGRKHTLLIVAIPFIISWTMKVAAQNAWWLLAARVLVGIGCSGVIINIPIYIAEIAENEIRGSLGTFLAIFLNAGCLFSYSVGSFTSYHGLATICLCIPIIFLIIFPNFPESPVSLWNSDERSKAEKSLLWFRGGNKSQAKKEMELLKAQLGKQYEARSVRELFTSRGVSKALVISVALVLGQNFCGILAILTYSFKIFQDSGSSLSARTSTIIIGLIQLTISSLSSFLVDRAGRRILLISSYIAMCISLTTLAGYLYFQEDLWHPFLRWIPFVSISLYVTFYSIGVGPLLYIVISEIFTHEIRGLAISKIQLLETILSFITVKTFPLLGNVLGLHGCFLLYALFCAILSLFTYLKLPETKGKTLQTIQNLLNGEDMTTENNHLFELQTHQQKLNSNS